MKKIKKRRALSRRWLAMLLTLAMCLGTLPFSAFAADGSQDGQAAVESYQDSTPSEAGGPENDGGQVVTGDADESNDDGNEIVTGDADESNNDGDGIVTGDENESNDGDDGIVTGDENESNNDGDGIVTGDENESNNGDDEIVTGDENESNNGDDQIITGDEDESDDDQIVTGDEEEDEADEEEQNGIEDESVIPDDVKAFLDAVAAIPEITPENAEEVAEYVYGKVSDCYEVLLDTEYMDREDVQEAEAVYAAAIEAIDAALDMESDYLWIPSPNQVHTVYVPATGDKADQAELEFQMIYDNRLVLPVGTPKVTNNNPDVANVTAKATDYDWDFKENTKIVVNVIGLKATPVNQPITVKVKYDYIWLDYTGDLVVLNQTETIKIHVYDVPDAEVIKPNESIQFPLKCSLYGHSGNDFDIFKVSDKNAISARRDYNTITVTAGSEEKEDLTLRMRYGYYELFGQNTYYPGCDMTQYVDVRKFTVKADDDTAPDAPEREDLPGILGNFVEVKCDSDPVDAGTDAQKPHSKNQAKQYSTWDNNSVDGKYESEVGKVYKNGTDWKVDVTLNGDVYAKMYSIDPDFGTGVKHTLKTGVDATQKITLKWNAAAKEGKGAWVEANDKPKDTVLATFLVVCAPEYKVIYKDGLTGPYRVFADETHEKLKAGVDTPSFANSQHLDRKGYTFLGWMLKDTLLTPPGTVKEEVAATDANDKNEIIYTAKWKPKDLTGFTKELVAEAPAGVPADGITFPNAEGKVSFGESNAITLLYKFTVTGVEGTPYVVTDTGATFVSGNEMTGTIPASGKAVIYVTRTFKKSDINSESKLVNKATAKPGSGNDKTISAEKEVDVAAQTYMLKYDANGGSDAPAAQGPQASATFTISPAEPTRTGYAFAGWADSADAKKATYQPGRDITLTEPEKTLYAVWAKISVTKTMKKLDGGSPGELLRAGDNVRYTVTVKNTGSNPLEKLQFFDDMDLKLGKPAKITIDSGWNVTSSYYPADEANPKPLLYIKADGNKLAPGASVVVQYEAEITKADGKKVINTVDVYADIDKSVENVSRRMAAFRSNDLNSGASSEGDTAKTDDINVGTGDNGDRPKPPTGGVSGSGSTGGNGADTKEEVWIKILWVDEAGESRVQMDCFFDKGAPYDLSEAVKKDVPDGYAIISIPDNVKGTADDDDTIKVVCGKDVYGPTDEKDSTKKEGSDGIPDSFQAVVTYKVENGTWDGNNAESKDYVFTLYEKDANDVWQKLTGEAVPKLGTTVPDVKNAKPAENYTAKGAVWKDTTPTADTQVTGKADYTYSFKKQEAFNVTIKYVDEDGKEIPGSEETIRTDKDGSYDVSKDVEENVPDDYAIISIEGDTDGTADDDVTITVTCGKDVYGPTDENDPTKKEGSDGIPDKYQAVVTYKVEHGTWDGTNVTKEYVFTLYEKVALGVWKELENSPTLGTTVPDVKGATPDKGFTAEGAAWNTTPTDSTPVTGDVTYTYSFKAEVPAEDATVTYPEFNGDKETGTPDTPPTAAEDEAAPGTTIIVNPNGGSWTHPEGDWTEDNNIFTHIAANGEKITLPDPARNDGYVFVGWTKDEAEDGEDNKTITYTAQWAEDTRGNDNGNRTEESDGIPDVFQPIVTYTVSGGTWEGTNGATVKEVVFNLVEVQGGKLVAVTPAPTLGTIPTPVVNAETNTEADAHWDGTTPTATTEVPKNGATYTYVFPELEGMRTITVERVHNGEVVESIPVTVPEGEGYTVTDTEAPETFDNGGNHYIRTGELPVVEAGSGDVTVAVEYAIDNIGGGANGSSPDGIPDNLEAVVYYRSSNTAYGTVRDAYQAFDLRPDGGSSTVTLRNAASTLGRAVFTNWASGSQVLATGAALENEFTVEAGQTYTVTANFTSGGGTGGGGGGGGGGTGNTGNTNTNTNTNTDTNTNDNTVTINDADVPLADLTALNREDHFAYVSGYTDGTVRPTNNITREEVAAIFYRLLTDVSRTVYETGVNNFSDVDSSRWSNNAVSTLANAGIISGYTDGTFKPGQTITRAEFAAIAARFDDMSADVANPFTDTAGHWAEQMISSAADKGWVGGYPDNTFRPKNAITRAEAMTLINNVLDREVDEAGLLADAKQWPDNQKDKWYYYEVLEATNSHDYTRRGSDSSVENWTAITQK